MVHLLGRRARRRRNPHWPQLCADQLFMVRVRHARRESHHLRHPLSTSRCHVARPSHFDFPWWHVAGARTACPPPITRPRAARGSGHVACTSTRARCNARCRQPIFGRPPPLATWHALLILLPLVARGRYRQPIWAITLSPRPPTTGSSRALRARSRSMTRHRYGISGYLAPSMAFHDFHRPACLHATPTHADGVRGGGATARSVVSPIWICPPRPGRGRR